MVVGFFMVMSPISRIRKQLPFNKQKSWDGFWKPNLKIRCQQESDELPTTTGLLFRIQQNEAIDQIKRAQKKMKPFFRALRFAEITLG